jgi:hypothetical protein
MAKTSMVNRDIKRTKLVKKYAAKRGELKSIVLSATASYEEKMEAQAKLQKLPRDASPVAPAYALRFDRSSARRVCKVRPRPQQAA